MNRTTSADEAPVRLLFVVNTAWFFVSHRLPLGLEALSRGWEVHLAAAADSAVEVVRDHGIHFHPIPFTREGHSPLKEAATYRALVDLYRGLAPDLVHHVTVKPVLWGSFAAGRAGVPAVVNAISGLGYLFVDSGWTTRLLRTTLLGLYRVAFRRLDHRVIFQNPEDRDALTLRGTVDPSAVAMIRGSGVDLDSFRPGGHPGGHPGRSEPVVVLASRMLLHKGVREFVEAARILARRGVGARMVLVGDTDAGNPSAVRPDELRRWSEEGVVEWWGFREDMPAVFGQADVACLPSYREGLPKVLLEAAAAGLPIVSTDVPGCREVVRPGENGLLVPPRDAAALADALESMVNQPGMRERMGRRGREMAAAEFSIERVVGQTFDVYRDLLR